MKNKTCYIAVFYLGERRREVEESKNDKLFYLKTHLAHLSYYSHNIDDIFLVFNLDKEHHSYIPEIENLVPNKILNTNVTIITRENKGFSYGAWNDVIETQINNYDYFILNEDDYYFVQDNWDQYLIDKFNSYTDCGYVCPLVKEPVYPHEYQKHAAHSSGITSAKVLKDVIDKFGKLPFNNSNDYAGGVLSQIDVTHAFIETGYNIYDIRDDYRVLFAMTEPPNIEVWKLFYWNSEHLILPAIGLHFNKKIRVHTWWEAHDDQYHQNHRPSTLKEALRCKENEVELEELRSIKYNMNV